MAGKTQDPSDGRKSTAPPQEAALTHGVALFYHLPPSQLDSLPSAGEKPRLFQGGGLLVALHVRRSGLSRDLRTRGSAGVRDVLSWRLAVRGVRGDAWRDLRTVSSTAAWRRLWTPTPAATFRFHASANGLELTVSSAGRPELELEARFAVTSNPSILGHRTCAEAELFGDPGGCRDLIRLPLGLERMELVSVSASGPEVTEVLGAATPDSVYRITERRLVGKGARQSVLRDAQTAPILPTPS